MRARRPLEEYTQECSGKLCPQTGATLFCFFLFGQGWKKVGICGGDQAFCRRDDVEIVG